MMRFQCYNNDKYDIEFCGEIYGEIKGIECILFMFDKLGPKMIEKIDGVFAFSLKDKINNIQYLFRDHFGIMPFYYMLGKELLYSTNLNELSKKQEINWNNIIHFFSVLFIPSPLTAYKNIYSIEPFSYLQYKNNEVKCIKYSLEKVAVNDLSSETFVKELAKIIETCCIKEDRVGTLLSGGVDSSLMSSLIKNKDICSYTADVNKGELESSNIISRNINSKHYLQKIGIKEWMGKEKLSGQLFADIAIWPIQILLNKIKEDNISKVFVGEGADLFFDNYECKVKVSNEFKREMISNAYFTDTDFFLNKSERDRNVLYLEGYFLRKYDGFDVNFVFPYLSNNIINFSKFLSFESLHNKSFLKKAAATIIGDNLAYREKKGLDPNYTNLTENIRKYFLENEIPKVEFLNAESNIRLISQKHEMRMQEQWYLIALFAFDKWLKAQ